MIEHISNAGAFLTQARKHLAPGGKLIITTPYPFCLYHLLYAFVNYPKITWNVEHTCWYCPQTLTELCRRAGLRVLDWDLIEVYPPGKKVAYRAFVTGVTVLAKVMPKRLRGNTMLFELGVVEDADTRPYRMDILQAPAS